MRSAVMVAIVLPPTHISRRGWSAACTTACAPTSGW